MKKLINDIIKSFKQQPIWTIYSLILAPVYWLLLALTAVMFGLINLSAEEGLRLWDENK